MKSQLRTEGGSGSADTINATPRRIGQLVHDRDVQLACAVCEVLPVLNFIPADRELAPGWDRFDTSTEETEKAEDMAATGYLMGRTVETQTKWEEIRVRVIRSEVPGEFVVVTRKGLEKLGEYFTDDKADANTTAQHIAKAYADRGYGVRVFAK